MKERHKKNRHPKKWAAMMAARKVKRFKTLNQELEGGNLDEIERAILEKATAKEGDHMESDPENEVAASSDESSSSSDESDNWIPCSLGVYIVVRRVSYRAVL
jgi:hypothetical protein